MSFWGRAPIKATSFSIEENACESREEAIQPFPHVLVILKNQLTNCKIMADTICTPEILKKLGSKILRNFNKKIGFSELQTDFDVKINQIC